MERVNGAQHRKKMLKKRLKHVKRLQAKKASKLKRPSSGMTDVDPASLDQFIATGRTGRRNALPDILDGRTAETSTAGLPCQLGQLTCSEDNESSKSDTASASLSSTSTNTLKTDATEDKKS